MIGLRTWQGSGMTGSINDASFLEGISYLIQNSIIIGPTTESDLPDWVAGQ